MQVKSAMVGNTYNVQTEAFNIKTKQRYKEDCTLEMNHVH